MLIVSGKCCKDVTVTGDMLHKFTEDMYEHATRLNAPPEGNTNVLYTLY